MALLPFGDLRGRVAGAAARGKGEGSQSSARNKLSLVGPKEHLIALKDELVFVPFLNVCV
jgi:hypothetical protein